MKIYALPHGSKLSSWDKGSSKGVLKILNFWAILDRRDKVKKPFCGFFLVVLKLFTRRIGIGFGPKRQTLNVFSAQNSTPKSLLQSPAITRPSRNIVLK